MKNKPVCWGKPPGNEYPGMEEGRQALGIPLASISEGLLAANQNTRQQIPGRVGDN